VLPALIAFGIALVHYDGMSAPLFVGQQNFQLLQREPLFPIALLNALLFLAQAVPLRLLAALGLALFYARPRRLTGLYRAAAYLPTVIPDVAYALTWLWIFNPLYGPLNAILTTLGLPPVKWLTEATPTFYALIIMSVLQMGEGFVILLAALRSLPREIFDAARVDGASAWQQFTRLTLPLISPWLLILSLRDIVLMFQNTFTPAYIMTRGGPYYATYFIPQYIFDEVFDRFRFGYGATVVVIVFVITLALSALVYFAFEEWGLDDEE
jgi:multiple sugar transport system permease protein